MRICIITAGGAGMFCGSCMQDNTLVRSLRMAGADALLLPTYTPVRVDEDNASSTQVFMGGINVYLDSKLPGWRLLPDWCRSWLDRPGVVSFLSRFSSSTSAAQLGPLTVDLLKGSSGPQRREIEALVKYLALELKPDVIVLSNALISGIVPELRRQWHGQLACLIQGDDIFLKDLPAPWQTAAIQKITENCRQIDMFLTHSSYYSDHMSQLLQLPPRKFHTIPLAVQPPPATPTATPNSPTTQRHIGYFARICPEKGAFRFLDAAAQLLPQNPSLRMSIGGFLPALHQKQFQQRFNAAAKGCEQQLLWLGSPSTREEKFQLLSQFDWLCVPAEYREPKGLYVLEAALLGIPSLLPAHGAFPERLQMLQHGKLYPPDTPLADAIRSLPPNLSPQERQNLSSRCLEFCGMQQAGQAVLTTLSTPAN
ncbi:MAG: glycosyltransferase family 4 protein [Planctomycetaceae bacterium]